MRVRTGEREGGIPGERDVFDVFINKNMYDSKYEISSCGRSLFYLRGDDFFLLSFFLRVF